MTKLIHAANHSETGLWLKDIAALAHEHIDVVAHLKHFDGGCGLVFLSGSWQHTCEPRSNDRREAGRAAR